MLVKYNQNLKETYLDETVFTQTSYFVARCIAATAVTKSTEKAAHHTMVINIIFINVHGGRKGKIIAKSK